MSKTKIGITMGDINGIGPEVIIKALSDVRLLNLFTPIVYGSNKVISYHRNIVKNTDFSFITARDATKIVEGKINVINCWEENINITLGTATDESGKFAHVALDRAVTDLKNNNIEALVTAPINKKAMENTSFPGFGHTEFITNQVGANSSLMTMISDRIKLGLISNHLPVSEIASSIDKDRVLEKISMFHDSLVRDFGIGKPSIGVLGLNPHAGEEGRIGNEEIEIMRPVLIEMKKSGILVFGPFAADGYFGSGSYKKFDGTMAVYHDQGLIPFKILSFGKGTNYTAGLPVVRTSPDHGTGYDIAGKNEADAGSMREAIFLALDILRNRSSHDEMNANPLKKKPKLTEEVEE